MSPRKNTNAMIVVAAIVHSAKMFANCFRSPDASWSKRKPQGVAPNSGKIAEESWFGAAYVTSKEDLFECYNFELNLHKTHP